MARKLAPPGGGCQPRQPGNPPEAAAASESLAILEGLCLRPVIPFHFSPRYGGREEVLRSELERAFRGG